MRHLLLALPFALTMPFAAAGEHHHHDHPDAPASLGSHEHGAAELDAVLDGSILEIELRSPAINLLGFEHAPRDVADQRTLAETQAQLQQPDALFGLPVAARCTLDEARLESPLFSDDAHEHSAHNDIHAHYRYRCNAPQALQSLDLQALFEAFPGTEKVQAQVVGPNGQQGTQLRAGQARITF